MLSQELEFCLNDAFAKARPALLDKPQTGRAPLYLNGKAHRLTFTQGFLGPLRSRDPVSDEGPELLIQM